MSFYESFLSCGAGVQAEDLAVPHAQCDQNTGWPRSVRSTSDLHVVGARVSFQSGLSLPSLTLQRE